MELNSAEVLVILLGIIPNIIKIITFNKTFESSVYDVCDVCEWSDTL